MNESVTSAFDQAMAVYVQATAAIIGVFREMRNGGLERQEALALTMQFAELYWRGTFFKELGWPGVGD